MDRALSLPLFIFIFWVPITCCLSTVSISRSSCLTLVCALVQVGNSQRSSLTCSSFPTGIEVPVNPNVSFSGIVAGDGFVCALSSFHSYSISSMVCWRFSINGTDMHYKRIYEGPAIRQLKAGNRHICGLVNESNRLQCWQWKGLDSSTAPAYSSIAVGDDYVCGLVGPGIVKCLGNATNINAQSPAGNYTKIAAGSRHACALTFDYEMECWGDLVGEKPVGKFTSMALGESRSCALRVNETVVCWGQNNFSLPQSLTETYFIRIEAKRDIFCGVVKRNFSLYCWSNENENFESSFKVFDLVKPGSCSSSCPCGPLAQSGIFCPEGYSICQQCWDDFSVEKPPMQSPLLPPLSPPRSQRNQKMTALLVVGCVGSLTLSLVTTFFVFRYKCRGCRVHHSGRLYETGAPLEQDLNRPQKPQSQQASEKRLSRLASMGNAGQLTEFSLQLLLESTDNFSQDRRIGRGSFGSVYLGLLGDGRQVAIKRAEVSRTSSYAVGTKRQEDKDSAFIHELQSLSRLNHKNIIRLLGFYEDSDERVLVYEYMPNGTVHDHLHNLQNSPLMSWPARIKLALDAARGVEYLHEYAVPPIIHRDIKSSNILLDSTWTAKVSDFGLCLMSPSDDDDPSRLSLMTAGTLGYMDPEYYRLQQVTTKSDVYSFGVVLLELISGYKAIHRNENEVPRNVVDFVAPYIVQDEIERVLDRRVPPPTPLEMEALAYIGYLAADCVTSEGTERPSMTEVVNSLERALAACLVRPTSLSRSATGSST